MLEVAKQHHFHFDTAQMPLNVMDAHFRSFSRHVVPALLKEEVAVLGMKSMGDGLILKSNTVKPVECLQFALSLPTSVVITGIDSLDILAQAIRVVKSFQPFTDEQYRELLGRTAEAAAQGRFELFKTSNPFDSTAKHPEYLG
jgi:hypothetical protein